MSVFETLPLSFQQKAILLEIKEEDITENFIKGSGKGGQKINKTASAVQLKHIPTGIEVKYQKHRERKLNRIGALKLLIQKLELLILGKESSIAKKINKLKKQKLKRTKRSKLKNLNPESSTSDQKI